MISKMSELSFSDNVKYEVCKVRYTADSFVWFMTGLLMASSDGEDITGKIKACGKVAGRLTNLLSEWKIPANVKDGRVYIGQVPDKISNKVRSFLDGELPDEAELSHNKVRALLGGVCIAAGHISDPENTYKVELHLKSQGAAKIVFALLSYEEIEPVMGKRGGINCIKFKNGDYVSDFIGMIGADSSRLNFENIRIEHDLRKQITREVNCDDWNTRRQAEAGASRNDLFEKLLRSDKANDLPDELLQAARASIENPGASIAELGEMMNPPISKSGMNNRIKKLMRIAGDL